MDEKTAIKVLEDGLAELAPSAKILNSVSNLTIAAEHPTPVPEIGRITAEAVLQDYAETAESFVQLGNQIKEVANRVESYHAELLEIVKYMNEVAAESRKRAALIFEAIEKSSQTTAEVRVQAQELSEKVFSTPIMKNF